MQLYERKEKTIHTGFLGEARSNPLYASRLFLKRMGIPSETKNGVQGFTGLPDNDVVLLINSRRTTLSANRTRELLEWVKSGGHLITLATHKWRYSRSGNEHRSVDIDVDKYNDENEHESSKPNFSPDPLQRAMGVSTGTKILYEDLDATEQNFVDNIKEIKDDYEPDTLYKIRLKGADKDLAIANNWYHPILIDDQAKVSTEAIKLRETNFIVRQAIGDGLVTLVSSMDFIENKQIAKADHAEILWYLIHGLHKTLNQPDSVWLIHSDKMPSLWDILWRNSWAFILSLLTLFIAWLLVSTRRFGPIIPKEEDNRRSLTEHISSSGNFYWNSNDKQKLLESSRSALFQKLLRIHPSWSHLSENEQLKILSEKSGLKPEIIHRTLFANTIVQADDFTKCIRQLEEIRHSI
jgi:hypothetical protein